MTQSNTTLPEIGSTYVFRIEDGRYSACRVLMHTTGKPRKYMYHNTVFVICSKWIGDQIPSLDEPTLKEPLLLNHHFWKNNPVMKWISSPFKIPKDFIFIGIIEPTNDERIIESTASGEWASLINQPYLQWLWDNDKEEVLRRDKKSDELRQKLVGDRKKFLSEVTLQDLLERSVFLSWLDFNDKTAVQASQNIIADTIKELVALPKDCLDKDKVKVIKKCVLEFNLIDLELDQFIHTIEREDICNELENILYACRLENKISQIDKWRQW